MLITVVEQQQGKKGDMMVLCDDRSIGVMLLLLL
jgi:hypothetical protein